MTRIEGLYIRHRDEHSFDPTQAAVDRRVLLAEVDRLRARDRCHMCDVDGPCAVHAGTP